MFEHPWVFALLLPLAGGVFFLFPRRKGLPVPSLKTWGKAPGGWRTRFWWLAEGLWALILLVFIFLLAGPLTALPPQERPFRGLNLAVVLDRSGSMGARLDPEKPGTRFEGVKAVVSDFLSRRPGDAITLISFARFPETHTPLTASMDIIRGFLDLIPLALEEGESGTALGDALMLAGARLTGGADRQDSSRGAVILLTDGRNNAGTVLPEEGAKFLASRGLRLYAIGLGGTGYFVQDGLFGPSLAGQTVDLDKEGLMRVARLTGGNYFQADSPRELEELLKKLEEEELADLSLEHQESKKLHLAPGLWVLLFLLVLAPGVRWLLLRRDWE